jgi:hypothetical protein
LNYAYGRGGRVVFVALGKLHMQDCKERAIFDGAPMASKDTPKKYYSKSTSTDISRCRLCNSVVDRDHCKNLFRSSNLTVLRDAEKIYGCALPQENLLPHLICRPCERKLNNASS